MLFSNQFPFDPATQSFMFDDFICNSNTGALNWTINNSGTGSAPSTVGSGVEAFNTAQGTLQLSTGTLITGRSAIWLNANMGFGWNNVSQQWRVWTQTLSDNTETYQLIVGFGDTVTGNNINNQTNQITFIYDTTVSPNWICKTTANSISTSTTTSIPVRGTTFNTLRINVDMSKVTFYVNNVLAATHTTNIPGFLQFCGPLIKINKSAGLSARLALIDYFWQRIDWSTTR